MTETRRRLRTALAAEYCGLSPRTFEKYRVIGGGPPFIRLGRRAIAYDTADLDSWMASQRRQSTSDSGPKGAS